MLSRPLPVLLLALGGVMAAAGGAYVGARHNWTVAAAAPGGAAGGAAGNGLRGGAVRGDHSARALRARPATGAVGGVRPRAARGSRGSALLARGDGGWTGGDSRGRPRARQCGRSGQGRKGE